MTPLTAPQRMNLNHAFYMALMRKDYLMADQLAMRITLDNQAHLKGSLED